MCHEEYPMFGKATTFICLPALSWSHRALNLQATSGGVAHRPPPRGHTIEPARTSDRRS
jgi:hypothetical protein